ncbi:MAG: hypothetical protein DME69_04210 [Verrucomicrobia bacterium]|nr:MAG: hypothetical protein DME87_03525 [Verrucomicrobiota bacterium]PYJ79590.1 MAG: hypothetical protein DME69_04210 [Verrucomicrobiota bacterium]
MTGKATRRVISRVYHEIPRIDTASRNSSARPAIAPRQFLRASRFKQDEIPVILFFHPSIFLHT